MCTGTEIALIGLALSAATTAASAATQQQAANAQRKMNTQAETNIRIARNDAYANQEVQRTQERENATEALLDEAQAASRAAGTAKVAAGEAGVTGLSVDALLNDIWRQQGNFNSDMGTNYQRYSAQVDRNMFDAYQTGQSQAASLPIPQAPDWAGLALGLAQSGAQYGSMYRQAQVGGSTSRAPVFMSPPTRRPSL